MYAAKEKDSKTMKKRNNYPYNISNLRENNILPQSYIQKIDTVYTLGLGITTRCNLDCPFCYYHSNSNNEKCIDMSSSTLHNIFSDLPKLKSIHIALEGEPFANKQIFNILDYIADKSNTLAISTNGILLTHKIIKQIRNYDFSLSIDASDKYSYERIRKGGQFNIFIKNAEEMVNNFQDSVVFNSVLFDQNIKPICGLPKLANKIGIHRLGIMRIRMHDYCRKNGISEPSYKDINKFIEIILENADKYNISVLLDRSFFNSKLNNLQYKGSNVFSTHKNFESCPRPWHYTSLFSDGRIFPCCGDFQPELIESYSFDTIFNNEYLLRLRSSFITKHIPKACASCYS